jgi:hypothetical protein
VTDETPKPRRISRRWIIVGVLLLVVGAACWWNWPRGDARFVGRWTVTTVDGYPGESEVWTLNHNGTGELFYPAVGATETFPWRVTGTSFSMGFNTTGFEDVAEWTSLQILQLTTRTFMAGRYRYDIQEIGHDEIRLQDAESTTVLRRIPE